MPKATDHHSSDYVKLLLIGESGAGKTGALAPLVKDGYKLKIIDMDAGLDALINHVREIDSKLLEKIEYETFRDQMKMTQAGPKVAGVPKAYVQALAALESWPEDDSDPATWGKDTILVIDSLTNMSRAAMQWAKAANPTSKDPRQWYKTAQDLLEDLIANLTSESFKTNVIIISHVDFVETKEGFVRGYASSIGRALGPKIPRFFNTMLLSETRGTGNSIKRNIHTVPTGLISVKNPAPMKMDRSYDISDGMSKIFSVLKNS